MSTVTQTRRIDVNEYYELADTGGLPANKRVELLEGEIYEMTPIGNRHAYGVSALHTFFSRQLNEKAVIWIQHPLRLSDYSEPEPDVMLLKPPLERYKGRHPMPDDVYLIVEVADSSLHYDRKKKIPIYAAYGIPEYWLVDLERGLVEVYHEAASGGYRQMEQYSGKQTISPMRFPECRLVVNDLLS